MHSTDSVGRHSPGEAINTQFSRRDDLRRASKTQQAYYRRLLGPTDGASQSYHFGKHRRRPFINTNAPAPFPTHYPPPSDGSLPLPLPLLLLRSRPVAQRQPAAVDPRDLFTPRPGRWAATPPVASPRQPPRYHVPRPARNLTPDTTTRPRGGGL